MNITNKDNINLYYEMLRIRMIEEAIATHYANQKMRTPVHLSIGQEAAAVASGFALRKTDYAVSSHRAHAHYLAKGGNLNAMIAEIHGKVTGCCRGRGGSMHLIDPSVGFMGSTAIVGNTIPIGVGLGLSLQLNQDNRICCIYLGDGAIEEGVFYESLNFAVLKKLPILFICENNLYSVYTPLHKRQPLNRKIHEMVAAIGAKTALVTEGYDVLACVDALQDMSAYVRSGNGVGFVEIYTYRYREHCGPNYDNDIGYRHIAEYESWLAKDSISLFQKKLIQEKIINPDELEKITSKIKAEIECAFEFAEKSVFPDKIEATSGEYAKKIQEEVICVN
ncbi:MAG: acetoin dehydrogenase [Gammaproteobacteria bacterium CG_4_10_14_0_8_um_filter_38_16]|nr:MAG: acetoin dehydrogenase [Gammaproteobacteria bacterium CG_4_10_14_0_8_um_filter_38_16]PJA04107.1 MAG: acetoin dehydrogenase [Gammaproteobacteria bacterium CG_4_10_14_0_2_um_filter_38_22]PJB10027.1 MAG: acetoin dehydrogenase [Gammaproteobacteria bacterium CG_4_9_14_3_um_filter_38_9]